MDSAQIAKRYQQLKADRTNIEEMWDFMEKLVVPYRVDKYYTTTDEGSIDWRKRDIYDMTAVESADALAASIQGNLISSAARWFDLKFSNDTLSEDHEGKEWLEEVSQIIYMALQTSNFSLEASESILDLVGFGTSALIEEFDEEDRELVFSAARS